MLAMYYYNVHFFNNFRDNFYTFINYTSRSTVIVVGPCQQVSKNDNDLLLAAIASQLIKKK